MKFIPIKTRTILPPRDDIYSVLDESLPTLRDGDILFITSKVLAIHQGRCAKFIAFTDKPTHRKSIVAPHNDLYAPFWRALK